MPITAVIIDEVQVFLENPTRQDVGERKTTLGGYIAELLTYLAKKGPAAGIIVILATQRPDSKTIPSALRAVLGSRFALRVMDWRDSQHHPRRADEHPRLRLLQTAALAQGRGHPAARRGDRSRGRCGGA